MEKLILKKWNLIETELDVNLFYPSILYYKNTSYQFYTQNMNFKTIDSPNFYTRLYILYTYIYLKFDAYCYWPWEELKMGYEALWSFISPLKWLL